MCHLDQDGVYEAGDVTSRSRSFFLHRSSIDGGWYLDVVAKHAPMEIVMHDSGSAGS